MQCLVHRSVQEQSSAHQHSPLAGKDLVLILTSECNAGEEKEQCFGIFAVRYARLGIDFFLKQYSFHRVKEARLQYQAVIVILELVIRF